MAVSKIVASVFQMVQDSECAPTECKFLMRYAVAGEVYGQPIGEVWVKVDATLADGALTNALKTAVAAAVDPLIFPPQSFAQSDVRGCNV